MNISRDHQQQKDRSITAKNKRQTTREAKSNTMHSLFPFLYFRFNVRLPMNFLAKEPINDEINIISVAKTCITLFLKNLDAL